ncbi:tripartite tricarboxylate transporter permease [Vineibacter terrae]|uniref:Tripartite tricarboxylate transporter permease n=1 Tax=Vineibacter terrae TaxID=2586908 RepID=A0A5C8PSW8_9HYPH|nr:tripartite tricarboxylate transporter permease [Vineibacter terrae]TXL79483.1 tripartite tricarboxylate transporter permease [Vineibacter terrae]
MLDSLSQFGAAFGTFMSPGAIVTVLWATFLGIVIGALPGLTATMGVALMTTLTFTMPHTEAILVLVCIYVGAIYGGSRSAILLNIPGTPASACSTLDGFPLARQGLAGRAMGISTSGSWLGTLFGTLCVATLTPVLAELALTFQSFEFFWIAVFGIVIAGTLSGGDALKGYLAGFLGLWIATIGQEPHYNFQRFAFGYPDLAGGIGLLPALVGAFGVAEVLQAMRAPAAKAVANTVDSVIPRIGDVLQYWRTILRSGAIGTFIGILPGLGEDTAAWSSYAAARRASKEKEKYGKGSIEGLMSAETGESACVPGAIIPVLTLAVPGSAPAAALMAAMLIHDINPGPMLMIQTPEFFYQIVAMLVIADMSKLLFGLTLVRPLLWILLVPRERLMPIVFVLCTVGAFAITSRVFDIYVMLFFGLIGFVLRELKFPMAPMILGLVLGELLESNLTRALVLSDGSIAPFFTRPISGVLAAITIFSVVWSIPAAQNAIRGGMRGLLRRRATAG